jgi:hypothetical protein
MGRKRIGESLEKQSSFFVKQTNEVEMSRGRMRRRKNSSELDHKAVKWTKIIEFSQPLQYIYANRPLQIYASSKRYLKPIMGSQKFPASEQL